MAKSDGQASYYRHVCNVVVANQELRPHMACCKRSPVFVLRTDEVYTSTSVPKAIYWFAEERIEWRLCAMSPAPDVFYFGSCQLVVNLSKLGV